MIYSGSGTHYSTISATLDHDKSKEKNLQVPNDTPLLINDSSVMFDTEASLHAQSVMRPINEVDESPKLTLKRDFVAQQSSSFNTTPEDKTYTNKTAHTTNYAA